MATVLRRTEVNECRECSTFCDRVIAPASCVADGCPYLYAYDDPLSGRRFMGCIHVELFREAERTKAGFGTVRLAAVPLPRCRFTVEQAYDGRGLEAYRCVNKGFFDWPAGFDLRDRCHQ